MSTRGFSAYIPSKDTVSTLAIVVTCAVVCYAFVPKAPQRGTQPRDVPPPGEPIAIGTSQTKGSPAARLAMIIYSDFQCPFCARFALDTLPTIIDRYVSTGDLMIVFKNDPLPIHQFARRAASFAACAGEQGKFWEMHDTLFANRPDLSDATMNKQVGLLKLDGPRLDECLSGRGHEEVLRDEADAEAIGVKSTPTFMIGFLLPEKRLQVVTTISGAQPVARFVHALDGLLAQK